MEFYKLAAQIIPVLWIGSVLERMDPETYRRQGLSWMGPVVQRTARFALIALPLVGISEAVALIAVATDTTHVLITLVVALGVAAGGLMLLGPLLRGWIRAL